MENQVPTHNILFALSKGLTTFKTELKIDQQQRTYDNFDIEQMNAVIAYYNTRLTLLKKEQPALSKYRKLKKHRLIKLR